MDQQNPSVTFSQSMLQCVHNLWKLGDLCDLTLICQDDEKVRVHKVILISASAVLHRLHKQGKLGQTYFLQDVDLDTLEILIGILYGSPELITLSNVHRVHQLAHKLEINIVIHLCDEFKKVLKSVKRELCFEDQVTKVTAKKTICSPNKMVDRDRHFPSKRFDEKQKRGGGRKQRKLQMETFSKCSKNEIDKKYDHHVAAAETWCPGSKAKFCSLRSSHIAGEIDQHEELQQTKPAVSASQSAESPIHTGSLSLTHLSPKDTLSKIYMVNSGTDFSHV